MTIDRIAKLYPELYKEIFKRGMRAEYARLSGKRIFKNDPAPKGADPF